LVEQSTERGAVWLAHSLWERGVVSSNLTVPTRKDTKVNTQETEKTRAELFRRKLEETLEKPQCLEALYSFVEQEETRELWPELEAMKMDFEGRHKDIFNHSIQVAAKMPNDFILRLGALLHDIGKPPTRKIENGEVTFANHETVGSNMAKDMLERVNYSLETVEAVTLLVNMSGRFKTSDNWSESGIRRFVRDAGAQLERLLLLSELDITSKHEHKHRKQKAQIERLRRKIEHVAEIDAEKQRRPKLSGEEIMKLLDVKPGPLLGTIQRELLRVEKEKGQSLTQTEAEELAKQVYQNTK